MPELTPAQQDDYGAKGPQKLQTVPMTLLALFLRAAVVVFVAQKLSAQWLFSQATELGCMANSLVHGQGLASPFCGSTGPSAFLAPGYPAFVACVFRLFGPYTKHSAVCIVCVQALLSTATVPVAMWAARRALGTRAANVTGLLCALNPWLIGLEAVLWESSLSILLMTLLFCLAVVLRSAPGRRWWYIAASVMALAAMVNPSLVPAGLSLFAAAVVLRRPGGPSADWLLPALVALALCCWWPIRNERVLHAFVPLRSNMGYELWQGNRPGADGFFQAKLHPNVNQAEFARYATVGEVAYMREKSEFAHAWISAHPALFTELTLKRAACFWFGIGRKPSPLVTLSTTALTLLGLFSLGALARADSRTAMLFAVPLVVLPLPYYITHPDFRFWCMLAPLLTMLFSWWISERFRPAQTQSPLRA